MIHWVPADPPYRDAVCGLLTKTAMVIAELDRVPGLENLLSVGAEHEAQVWRLPGIDAASRLVREARFQTTRTVSIEPRDRDDPVIAVTIEVLERHPAEPVARLLHAAARDARRPHRRPPDRR